MDELLKQFGNASIQLNNMAGQNIINPGSKFPKYYLVEHENKYIYNFKVPGYKKENIRLSKKGNNLMITGNMILHLDGGTIIKNECTDNNNFNRVVTLVGDCSQIDGATFNDGILSVTITRVTSDDEESVSIN
jgi:HSP20 family molecular chaperone IbpA